ncbi:MAG TPA: VOC family protein, partial [Devosia sp.]|nr:VOC family protein [Devosia sp.]
MPGTQWQKGSAAPRENGNMTDLELDHMAFGALDLEQGIERMSALLGAPPVGGGRHALFGTHNALWRVETGDEPVYLEVIAADPDGPRPSRKRWFGLDDPQVRRRLEKGVHLLSLVVRCTDFAKGRAMLPDDPGPPVAVSRGALRWQFSLAGDGGLIQAGASPYLIAWADDARPALYMPEQ